MYEIRALNPDAIQAELAYRRQQLVGNRVGRRSPEDVGGGAVRRAPTDRRR